MRDETTPPGDGEFWRQQEKGWRTVAVEATLRADRSHKTAKRLRAIAVCSIILNLIFCPLYAWRTVRHGRDVRELTENKQTRARHDAGVIATCAVERDGLERRLRATLGDTTTCARRAKSLEEELDWLPNLMTPACGADYKSARKVWANPKRRAH